MLLAAGAISIPGLLGVWTSARREALPPQLVVRPARILADGYDIATIAVRSRARGWPQASIVDGAQRATIQGITGTEGRWDVHLVAGIVPGRVRVRVGFPGSASATADLDALLDTSDSLEDGTPDFLRLSDETDRQAFRRWFTWLAEAQYFQRPEARPGEIVDCAALIRYAYREALHAHDGAWVGEARLPLAPAFESVAKYRYPHTPQGAALFRVRPGPFRASDLADGAFAQFADAQTLWRFNCHFVSREVSAARPGDLFFYRRESGGADEQSFHTMIYIGESQLRKDGQRYVVYHTGNSEMRRLSMTELQRFPQPEWRPMASNPEFLGVYRWNILRSAGTN